MSTDFRRRFQQLGGALVAALLFLVAAQPAEAQQGAVTGQIVRASNGQPISGAQVVIRGTNLGTLTDSEGNYRVTGVPTGPQTVQIRVIGFERASRRVQVQSGQAATANFRLEVSAVSLDEIVVTQTGEQSRRQLTTNMATVDAVEKVQNVQPVDMQGMLQGQVSGAVITNTSGSVGSSTNFTIRGASSISLDNTPIIYIDGVRVNSANANLGYSTFFTGGQTTSRISDLNPQNIESIQVLKGPSATTLYGSDAAAGVIRITTRQGGGDPNWQVRANVGGNWDVTDWRAVTYNPTEDPLIPLGFAKDTLYQMELLEGQHPGISDPFRTGIEQEYSVQTSGSFADGQANYFLSGTYENRDGNLPANYVRSNNARANFGWSAQNFTVQVNSGFVGRTTLLPQNDNNSFGYIGQSQLGIPQTSRFMRDGVRTCPLAFELFRVGAFSDLETATDQCFGDGFLVFNFEDAGLTEVKEQVQRFTGSVNATYQPFGFLTARATIGYDEAALENRSLVPVVPRLQSSDQAFNGSIDKRNSTDQTLTIRASATTEAGLTEDIRSTTTAGGEWIEEQIDAVQNTGFNFPAGSPTVSNSVVTTASDFFDEERTISGFAEQEFSWRNRLFINAGVRVDENSAFGENLGAKWYPRAGFSYVLSESAWFPDVFDQFKARFSWGQSGKQPGTNDALQLLAFSATPFRGSERAAVSLSRPGSPDLKPERDEEIEAGVDMGILDGRLSGSFTWYRQIAENAVVSRPLAPSRGFPNAQIVNVGRMTNTGIEAELTATAFSRPDLQWDWTVQASTNYNNIDSLASPIDVGFAQRHAEGRPFGAYYGTPIVEQNGDFVPADSAQFLGDGDGLTPNPRVSGSVSSTMTLFDRFTLYALADVSAGRHLGDNTESFMCWFLGSCARAFEVGPDGERTREAEKTLAAGQAGQLDSEAVKPADFVKLRTASLRFRVPQQWVGYFGASSASIQVTGSNLMTWTPYTGTSPELNTFGSAFQGGAGEFLTLPPARKVSAEIQLSF